MTAFFSWQHAIRSSKLESTTKLVCYTIWSHMASDGTGCFPSYALIASESGLSRRCVIEHVDKAEKAGFLVVDNRQRENGSASSNVYRPTMPTGGDPSSLGGGDPAAPPEDTTLSNNPPSSKPKTKASPRALPVRSLAVLLEDLATIPTDLFTAAWEKHGIAGDVARDEWAKFRNYHISARSKHTRIDLCWDTWCRNAAKWQGGGKAPAGGKSGQGGFKRHDHVAAAKDRALAELFGVGAEGHGGAPAAPSGEAGAFGSGDDVLDAIFENAGASHAPVLELAGGSGGSNPDCSGGSAVPLEVERG